MQRCGALEDYLAEERSLLGWAGSYRGSSYRDILRHSCRSVEESGPAAMAAQPTMAAARLPGSAVAGTGALAGSLSRHAWGGAEEVPGIAALNQGGNAFITSVSCA